MTRDNFIVDTGNMMSDIYSRCSMFLQLRNRPNVGVTVLLSPRWMFVTLLTQPYVTAPNGNPSYLDGFDFAGIVSLQETSDTWPATAGLDVNRISIFEAFEKSTKHTLLAEEDDLTRTRK